MALTPLAITSPVGRVVQGSLYDPETTDMDGKPLVVKSGADAGQPRVNFYFALAIPKGSERHWGETTWGQKIWAYGNQAFPNIAGTEDFSWKIIDGDSRKPGKAYKGKPGKAPFENEGFPGNWIIKFSGGFAPKIVKYDEKEKRFVDIVQKDFIVPGHFVEVAFEIKPNTGSSPGLYVNYRGVCFRAYGTVIDFSSFNVEEAGFGQSALPAGATMTPPAGAIPMPLPNVPAGSVPVPAVSVPSPAAYVPPAAPVSIPVIPSPAFVQVPPPAAPAPVAPSIPVIPVHQMTAAAGGATYEACIAAGWTDAMLVANGMMLA